MLLKLLLLTTITYANAATIKDCSAITVKERETLHEGLDRPYLLTVDHSTNILYFSYSDDKFEEGSKTARLNLNTDEFHDIKGVTNGFAQTIDQETHEIYIGGSDGIYKYNYKKDEAEFLGEKGVNIWYIYFNDILYYSVYPSQFVYTYKEGVSTRFKDLEDTKVDSFVIDNDNTTFYTNSTGLYGQKKDTKDAVVYKEFNFNPVRGITVDKKDKVYVCMQDGIYVVNKETVSLDKVVDVSDAFGVAFDIDNNLIYADSTKLVRLKYDKNC